MPEPILSQMQPQRFVQTVETILGEERPIWSRKALAKFLTLIFPKFPSKKWEACLAKPSKITGLVEILTEDEAWVLGRIHRALCEARAEHLWEKPPLTALSWLETGDLETGAPNGGGFQTVIAKYFEGVVRQPVSAQIKFWKSFSEAYALSITNRQHDSKTVLAYIYVGLWWRDVQQCNSIREAYEKFRQRFTLQPPPPGTDAIDFEDRQLKWFEKLCQRNLSMSLTRRGRPARKLKNPQP
jgi:hypothetical protein